MQTMSKLHQKVTFGLYVTANKFYWMELTKQKPPIVFGFVYHKEVNPF